MIPLTVPETRRLLAVLILRPCPPGHAADWLEWRRLRTHNLPVVGSSSLVYDHGLHQRVGRSIDSAEGPDGGGQLTVITWVGLYVCPLRVSSSANVPAPSSCMSVGGT